MAARNVRLRVAVPTALLLAISAPALAEDTDKADVWSWGATASAGYFNFRNSLYVDHEPDSPGNLGEDWLEFVVKPWAEFERHSGDSSWFGKASWAYVRTDEDAAEIGGGHGDSADFDELYLGFRKGSVEAGQFEIAAGRYSYQLAHAYLLADGNADGGSRGGYWSNARTAWAPGGRIQYQRRGHTIEAFYLDRDERPESDADTTIGGINYEWLSADDRWNLGASYFEIAANSAREHLDGARVYNLRAYFQPFAIPLNFDMEFAREYNGEALDASAWYVMVDYTFNDSRWRPFLKYRYAFYEGDNPNTSADESFDPLFPGFEDWGTWWQGEIAGEYFLANSNLKTHMLQLRLHPSDNVSTSLLFFDYRLHQPGSYQGGVNSSEIGQEVNFILDWAVTDSWNISFIIAHNQPGDAVEEAHDRTRAFEYAMVYATFSLSR
jgi:hypothetical protein